MENQTTFITSRAEAQLLTAEALRIARLRYAARKLGVKVQKRYNYSFGRDGYMLIDIWGNYVLDGASPVAYSLTLDEAEAIIRDYGEGES